MLADSALGIRMHSYFQMADMWERPYAKARDVIAKPAAQGILNGKVYTKKLSWFVLSRLAAILDGAEPLEDVSIRWWTSGSTEALLSLQHFALQKNGGPMYVWYAPTDVQDERGTLGELELACETTADLRPMKQPVILDLLSGDVFDAGGSLRRDGWFGSVPLCESPLILCDASLIETETSRA